MNRRVPGEGRYAKLEREQRWTVGELPPGAELAGEILDRYIDGTRLRLRRVRTSEDVVFKLGQKVRVAEADPERVMLTNVYLSAEEHAVVAALPARELRKSRWRLLWDGTALVIDEFHDRLEGLLLAEIELAPDEPRREVPPFAHRDVTNDDRYSGGALASASAELVGVLLSESRAQRDH